MYIDTMKFFPSTSWDEILWMHVKITYSSFYYGVYNNFRLISDESNDHDK